MKKGKILIVDDDPDIVELIQYQLIARGHEVIAASDGVQATRRAVLDKPDLIILDIGLPAGNGHVVAQRLRQNSPTTSMPIIFLTARANPEDYFKAMKLGAVRYLTKPFDMKELLATIDEVMGIGREEEA